MYNYLYLDERESTEEKVVEENNVNADDLEDERAGEDADTIEEKEGPQED